MSNDDVENVLIIGAVENASDRSIISRLKNAGLEFVIQFTNELDAAPRLVTDEGIFTDITEIEAFADRYERVGSGS